MMWKFDEAEIMMHIRYSKISNLFTFNNYSHKILEYSEFLISACF